MEEPRDLLQVKIEQAKMKLPIETQNAIATIDWKAVILGMRDKNYTFEQLGNLELETELLLAGLVNPSQYPKELETRMGISKSKVDDIVREMNEKVFKKIREELEKNTEKKKTFEAGAEQAQPNKEDVQTLDKAGIEIMPARNAYGEAVAGGETPPTQNENKEKVMENREEILEKVENPEPTKNLTTHPLLAQKLSGTVQNEVVETEHSLSNISKAPTPPSISAYPPKQDPYRLPPE